MILEKFSTFQLPFREAHHLAGKVVNFAESEGLSLCDVPLEKLKKIR